MRSTGWRLSQSEIGRILRAEDFRPPSHAPVAPQPRPRFSRKGPRHLPALHATTARRPRGVHRRENLHAGSRAQASWPPTGSGRAGRREFEYVRHGTRALLAAFDVKTGRVFGQCRPRRTAEDLRQFMDALRRELSDRRRVRESGTTSTIHHGEAWRHFNERHGGRFHFVYTPLHASWVNQNFAGASTTQLSDAAGLYAAITGRVSSITRGVALDENSHQYGLVPVIGPQPHARVRRLRAGYVARQVQPHDYDGMRLEKQGAFENLNGTYSRVGLEGLYGVSGIGNLFRPGTLTGSTPTFKQVGGDIYTCRCSGRRRWVSRGKFRKWTASWASSSDVMKAPPCSARLRDLHRARRPESLHQYPGLESGHLAQYVDRPGSTPADFGAPGSVLFRQANLPAKTGTRRRPRTRWWLVPPQRQ